MKNPAVLPKDADERPYPIWAMGARNSAIVIIPKPMTS
jgi:hypothetical protein